MGTDIKIKQLRVQRLENFSPSNRNHCSKYPLSSSLSDRCGRKSGV